MIEFFILIFVEDINTFEEIFGWFPITLEWELEMNFKLSKTIKEESKLIDYDELFDIVVSIKFV